MSFSHLCSTFCVISSLCLLTFRPLIWMRSGERSCSAVSVHVWQDAWEGGPQLVVFIGRKGTVGSRVKGVLVYSLTTPLRNITPHLKMEREKVKWRENLPQTTKLHTHKQWFVSFHQWGDPAQTLSLFSSFLSYLLIGGAWFVLAFFRKPYLIVKSLLLFIFTTSSEIQIKLNTK